MDDKKITKLEVNLLLHFEDCAVNHGGLVAPEHLNDEDRAIMARWNESVFVTTGRVKTAHVHKVRGRILWCHLSDDAWQLAAQHRKERGKRIWEQEVLPLTQ